MRKNDFNDEASSPRYLYQRSPVHDRSFRIMRHAGDTHAEPVPVGDYTVLDLDESPALSEKKVMNVIAALNGRSRLVPLGEETKSRQLYQMLNDGADGQPSKIMFYSYDGSGVSKESAMMIMEGGAE